MPDLVQDSAIAFSKLLKYSYITIQFNANNMLQTVSIVFSREHYKHLSGIQKCKDITSIPTKADLLFRHAIAGKISHTTIKLSDFYHSNDIEGRLNAIVNLEANLKNTKYIYRFNERTHIQNYGNTQIRADYFFKFNYINPTTTQLVPFYFYFIRKDISSTVNSQFLFCSVSIFSGKKDKDFTKNQKKYAVHNVKFIP